MGKTILLIAPTISDIYKDVIYQLEEWGMTVDFIKDNGDIWDPDFIRITRSRYINNTIGRFLYNTRNKRKWRKILASKPYTKAYDYLLVIDGMSLHPYLFEELKKRNSNIWMANYLFDSTISLYRFQLKFSFFDRVASFDKLDCTRFQLHFLPIYWIEASECQIKYDIFALGGYGKDRFTLFEMIERIANEKGLKKYIKLYTPYIKNIKLFKYKSWLKLKMGIQHGITLQEYESQLITTESMPAYEYRNMIQQSRIIVDSVNYEQDGMTARFMWALGAGKKIVTTNQNIKGYPCYNPNQILLISSLDKQSLSSSLSSFLTSDFQMTEEILKKILPWRIDNWLRFLLNIQ